MILIFIDETSDVKYKKYFGLCCAVINSAHYRQVKKQFQNILINAGWDTSIEFKGSLLFSASKGDLKVPIEKRITIAEKILALNTAKKNSRIKFHYFRKNSSSHKKDYLKYIPKVLEKALPRPNHKNGKDIVSIQCDHRTDIKIKEIRSVVAPVLEKKEYILFEDIVMPSSRFETVGILYADLIGYLKGRIENIRKDSDLFENIPKKEWEKNGKIKKYLSSKKLLRKIKDLNLYKVKSK